MTPAQIEVDPQEESAADEGERVFPAVRHAGHFVATCSPIATLAGVGNAGEMHPSGKPEGFIHRGRIVYSVMYRIVDGSSLIVSFDPDGNDINGRPPQ